MSYNIGVNEKITNWKREIENLIEDDLSRFGWLGDDVGTDVRLGDGINVGIDDGLVLPSTFELLGSIDW